MLRHRFLLALVFLVPLLLILAGVWAAAPVPRLDDDNPAVRAAAIRSFRGGSRQLIPLLADRGPDVRLLAVRRIGEATLLIGALNDAHPGVRREAAWTLSEQGAHSWPVLRKALTDENPRIRAGAALALAYTPAHKEPELVPSREQGGFVPILQELQCDPNPEVRRNAMLALQSIDR